ncbi:hypothetical protein BG004_006729 [Podila humilis]|nr:hypothetical protein BG004_006729 [Podila humilis]
MLRSFSRLAVSSIRYQPSPAMAASALFHTARINVVAVSANSATTPSTPLPPPMNTSSPSSTPSKPAKSTTESSTPSSLSSSSSSSSSSSASSSTTTTTTTTSAAAAKEEQVSEEEEQPTTEKSFADFIPLSAEQTRSLKDNPILSQLVNTIMKDGKKARAQRFVADALLEIRSRTQSDPYHVILDALELASPILKLTATKKGSKVLQVPTPMTERQRRRRAIVWILEASDKRKGEKLFKDRLASEFLAVINGNSGALAKKNQQHKMALANRANASLKY